MNFKYERIKKVNNLINLKKLYISFISAQDLKKSRDFAHKPKDNNTNEDDYAEDFDSISMSYREGKKSLMELAASQEKARKPNMNSASNVSNNKLRNSHVSHISENYGEEFDSYTQSASRIKTEYDNSSYLANSNSQKTAICYICNERIDPKKVNEHKRICKRPSTKPDNKRQLSGKNLIGSMDNGKRKKRKYINFLFINFVLFKKKKKISKRKYYVY